MALAVLAAIAGLAACDPAREERAPYPRRAGAALPRIVSLNPCSDAVLAEIAAPGQLLAISSYSQDPASSSMDVAQARRFRAVSGTVEEVLRLSPDLVVAGSYLPPATRSAFARFGIRVETLPMPRDLAGARDQVRALARIAGRVGEGEALVERIDRAAEMANPAGPPEKVSALIWENGGIVAGSDTLISDLLTQAGFINSAGLRGLAQADYLPLEQVLAAPPQVIFTVGSAQAGEDRLLRHPVLRALRGTRVVRLDGSLLWCGGPTIPRALARLAQVRQSLPR